MIEKTKILGMSYNRTKFWAIDPVKSRFKRGNVGYAAPFPLWWKKFGLKGTGYAIGEHKDFGTFIEQKLKLHHQIISVESVDFEREADVNIDISKEFLPKQVNFIFCMATLEHVVDISFTIRNMSKALTKDGLLCISVPNNKFKQHRFPIDCYRFLEDAMEAFAVLGNLKLLDYTLCLHEWCSIYKKE